MAQTVVGIFDKTSNAQDAIDALVKKGFDGDNINMSAGNKASGSSTDFKLDKQEQATGISGFFKNLFGEDKDMADRYDNYIAKSEAVVTVFASSAGEAEKAADIMDDNGAIDLNLEGSGNANTAMNMQNTPGSMVNATDHTANANKPIPIIEETMEVGKRKVQRGGMRLRSHIVEHPVEEQLRLREENVQVKRNKVDRPATDADFAAFKEGQIEMVEHAEVPVVSKQAHVVEEVSLGKEVNERNETIHDTVRKTEVDVEDMKKKITIDKLKN